MNTRLRAAAVAAVASLAVGAAAVPSAQANPLSLLPGSCGQETQTQAFSQWGDSSFYKLFPGGDFEAGSPAWLLDDGAQVQAGNEDFNVHGSSDQRSLTLPAGSSATSLAACKSIYDPTARLFVRGGSASSSLRVDVLYPGLLGGIQVAHLADLGPSDAWAPSPILSVTGANLLATLSLGRTAIALRFTPQGSGSWSIDDVYLDPHMRG